MAVRSPVFTCSHNRECAAAPAPGVCIIKKIAEFSRLPFNLLAPIIN
jgi:hypothetical protein